ncbi:hypothetical protein GOP47_0000383 [Adiantum capillus-veneris]|uniref:Uncharacterized protein n=1 Tax=Adiantum capillus-veneris TaxID=13818 RepID=A0A9D4VDT2_ADICA|nr:hypothetical protein GOP47_0000383 [Adiantum capillus-veneris]
MGCAATSSIQHIRTGVVSASAESAPGCSAYSSADQALPAKVSHTLSSDVVVKYEETCRGFRIPHRRTSDFSLEDQTYIDGDGDVIAMGDARDLKDARITDFAWRG